jgi:quercetin dioxygenase-like cupin family protein
MTESQGHTYLKAHTLSADALLLDLDEQANAVLEEARSSGASRAARTLIKDGPLRVTIVGLNDGGALKEHKAGGPVAIQILQGEVEVSTGGSAQPLTRGQCIVLGRDIEHSLVAHGPSVALVTIAMP